MYKHTYTHTCYHSTMLVVHMVYVHACMYVPLPAHALHACMHACMHVCGERERENTYNRC